MPQMLLFVNQQHFKRSIK